MIDLLLSTLLGFASGPVGWVGLAGGAVATLVGALFGGWKKWAVIGVGLLVLGGWITILKYQVVKRDLAIERLNVKLGEAAAARRVLEDGRDVALEANAAGLAALAQIKQNCEAQMAALASERDAAQARAAVVKTVHEVIRVQAKCTGGPVPDAIKSALVGLRELSTQEGRAAGKDGSEGADRKAQHQPVTAPAVRPGAEAPKRR